MAFFSFLRHRFLDPLKEFFNDSKAIGITLLSCTIISLLLSNLGFSAQWYKDIWAFGFDGTDDHAVHAGNLILPNSILLVINDLLMTVFFFLAGMEIKREMAEGELSSIRQSLLPVVAAIGGMLAPAVIFGLLNKGTDFTNGWAVPMATDIAFTLGVASLLGKRIPVVLKVFLTALAIIDDLGAIIVIALFYGSQIQFFYLLLTLGIIFLLWQMLRYKIPFGWYHWVLAILLWYCMFNSGIHATVAGVAFAFLIPVNQLSRLELKLHHPVYFGIMPLFALANTAITFPANGLEALNSTYSWGIIAGLYIGKPFGICLACYLMVKKKWADLPAATNWHHIIGAGILAGIGFTMSIFISTLAFPSAGEQDIAKMAVLLASFLAMITGYGWFSKAVKNSEGLKE
ncbi:MAG TPA: Na+/H+ antiporter NhaA [Sediminibacterium sp.]|nr:Na+/H+ antiporter NhaA [Sediminibacterium sp.]